MTALIYGFVVVFAAAFVIAAVIRRYRADQPSYIAGIIMLALCGALALDVADFWSRDDPANYWPSALVGLMLAVVISYLGAVAYIAQRKLKQRTS